MRKIKISFDFDDTLSHKWVQDLVSKLPKDKTEIYILTSRLGNMQRMKYVGMSSNEEIYRIASELGIPPYRISYTNQAAKWMVLNDSGIDIHVDDDPRELNSLKFGSVRGFDIKSERLEEEFMEFIAALECF
jgi:hypothetical protein